jgi:predicted transcriptional regulator
LDEWQIEEVKKALGEADHGDFSTEEDIKWTVEKWAHPSR